MIKDGKVYAPIQLPDYRALKPSAYLEKDGKKVYFSQQVSSFSLGDSKIAFLTPNSASIFLNKSVKEYNCGVEIFNRLIKPNLKKGKIYNVPKEDISSFYDYIEHIQTSIISIYSAIEALGNLAIPNSYTLEKTNNKGVKETWNKINIERWISTEEKIGKIVPEILGIESPSKLPLWEKFKELKKIRDEIIHQKHSNENAFSVDSNFFQLLLDTTISSKIISGFDLIKYFCEKAEMHIYFPMINQDVGIQVNVVDALPEIFTSAIEIPNPELNK